MSALRVSKCFMVFLGGRFVVGGRFQVLVAAFQHFSFMELWSIFRAGLVEMSGVIPGVVDLGTCGVLFFLALKDQVLVSILRKPVHEEFREFSDSLGPVMERRYQQFDGVELLSRLQEGSLGVVGFEFRSCFGFVVVHFGAGSSHCGTWHSGVEVEGEGPCSDEAWADEVDSLTVCNGGSCAWSPKVRYGCYACFGLPEVWFLYL
ncbi:hypothetical protein F3Y22_tig00016563pilonHSYRG00103 [Hibiscus syriacus]|uniref:Uncharacterized protein n=1 Tax=Hibiscus syriacus TaxID=106335 RepID=A0A6A3BXF3_HIBSY|nr:hypothetical protein F3Y22_tig00016563pilonHSYRG00103 [Hibiscus syriacus]